ncbi:MAG: UDP-N-acetylmuramoyl-tripeptide--D-alanyl-D-alanine ligase [Patescibacteria group bacterium]
MKKILQIILKSLSKATIRKYKPGIIGITGSVGKTSTKEAIFAVLKNKFRVRRAVGSFNTEEGLSIAILGDWSEEQVKIVSKFGPSGKKFQKLFFWLGIIFSGFLKLIFLPKSLYPEILILEYGSDRPGDIDKLSNFVRPQIGVVTAVGEIPVHVEFYSGPEEVAKEKSKLVKALPPRGLAVLNFDDNAVLRMKDATIAETITYGFGEGAMIRASDVSYFIDPERSREGPQRASASYGVDSGNDVAGGLSFKVNFDKNVVPFRLASALGKHQIYAALAAAAVGIRYKMNLVEISQALEKMEFPKQRMNLVKGMKNSIIIDDSYNASPLSMHAALDALKEFGDKAILKRASGRKIAVLGDMKELGIFTEKAHQLVGNLAGERADYLFTVGLAAKFIADSAYNQMPKENIISFNDSAEAGEYLKGFIGEGDIILVKGSRAMKMEKTVEALI